MCPCILHCWPGSSVGIAIGYGLDGPGIESRRGGEIFRTCPDRPRGPPNLLYNGYRVFPAVKERPRSLPPTSAVVKKEYSYTSTPPMSRTACTEPQCLHNGVLYFFVYCTSWRMYCTFACPSIRPNTVVRSRNYL